MELNLCASPQRQYFSRVAGGSTFEIILPELDAWHNTVSTCAYVVVWVGGLEVWELMVL